MECSGIGGVVRAAPVPASVDAGSVPLPPIVPGLGLLTRIVMLGGLAQKVGQSRNFHEGGLPWAVRHRPGSRSLIS
jgi:hypothetical protein